MRAPPASAGTEAEGESAIVLLLALLLSLSPSPSFSSSPFLSLLQAGTMCVGTGMEAEGEPGARATKLVVF